MEPPIPRTGDGHERPAGCHGGRRPDGCGGEQGTEWRHPSFGRELFLGRLRLDLVHPYPRVDDDERRRGEAFLARLEKFLRENVDPDVIEQTGRIPDEVITGLAGTGALGMLIDERYGGLGLSHLYYNRALMLASTAHSSLGALLSAHQSIGVPQPLRLFGTDAQKERFLPACAKDVISAFLLTEPDVGSDPARMHTTATPTPDGKGYTIDGVKLWTTNGVIAGLLVVMAQVPAGDGHKGGISAFVVDAKSPGITVLRRNEFMGIRGIENGVTRFENVFVPAENLIGKEGRGLKVALQTLNTGRLSLPAINTAAAKASLAIARQWSAERVQWGHPIGKHDAIAQKLAFIAGTTFAMESMVDLGGLMADRGGADIRIEAALAKLYCSEMAWKIADEMVQIRGGRGFETAHSLRARGERAVPAEQILRDLRIARIFEGSTEIMHLLIAREALDAHLTLMAPMIDPKSDLATKGRTALAGARFYGGWLPTLPLGRGHLPGAYGEIGSLAPYLRFVERSSRRLARSTFYAMARHRAKLEYRQALLGRIVDIAAELFAMTAACVRAEMLRREGRTEAVALARLFCRNARLRVDDLFRAMHHNDDTANYAAAQEVLGDTYVWLEEGILDLYGDGPMVGVPQDDVTLDVHREVMGSRSRKPAPVS